MSVELLDNASECMSFIHEKAAEGLKAVAEDIAEQYRANIANTLNTTGVSTGAAADGVKVEMSGEGMDSVARVGALAVYMRIHEFGGVITPKSAPYLVFQTADGEWVTTPSVTMPARPTLRPAAMMVLPRAGHDFAMGAGG